MLAAICLLSPSALAQTPECKTIPRGQRQTGLLRQGCTRGIGRQIGCGKTRDDSRGRPAKPGAEKYVDTIGAEDARMSAQLKNICRGC
jgi:hypothetical protein